MHKGEATPGVVEVATQVLAADEKRLHLFQTATRRARAVVATAEQMLLHVDTRPAAPARRAADARGLAGSRGPGWPAQARRRRPARRRAEALMDFGLTPEQEMVVDTVRGFVENELYPLEAEVERTGEVPREDPGARSRARCRRSASTRPTSRRSSAAAGSTTLTFTLLERELGRASYALSVFWGRPVNILCACDEEQRERYLLPAVRGERIDCLAMTEPEAGSDVRSMKTTRRRDGGDWVINGTKHFISHADLADFVDPVRRDRHGGGPTPGPKQRITCFLVDRGTPGFEIRDGYRSVSHRGYHNCILAFDDCRVPDAQVLGEEGGRLRGGEHVARRHPAHGRRDVRRPGPARARPRVRTRRAASSSASRSAGSRASRSSSPTWRPRSTPPTC